jgi:predicted dithiol-disulfide oxidoreductase (DUF899 family)
VLLSEQEWSSMERERVVSEENTDEITTSVSDVRKKRPWVAIKGDASYKHASPVRNYR